MLENHAGNTDYGYSGATVVVRIKTAAVMSRELHALVSRLFQCTRLCPGTVLSTGTVQNEHI